MADFGSRNMGFFGGSTSGGGGGISGSGTANTLSKWSSSTSLNDSQITDSGTVVAINNWLQFELNASGYTGYSRMFNNTPFVIGGLTNYSDATKPYITLGIVGGNNMANGTTFIQNTIGDVSQTSGTYTNTNITARVLSLSGSAEHRLLTITPIFNSGNPNTYTGTIRGLYYNLIKDSAFPVGANNIAWENVNGDIVFGNFSGSSLPNRVLQMDLNGKLAPQNSSFNLYNGSSQDILDATSGGLYRFGNIPLGLTMIIDTSLLKTTYKNKEHNIESSDSITTPNKTNFIFQTDLIKTTYETFSTSAQEGLFLDYSVRQYIFGGFDTNINLDNANSKLIIYTKNLQLDSITLNSSSTTISGNTIPITINSTQYYILLAT